jgi:hypothetical protein
MMIHQMKKKYVLKEIFHRKSIRERNLLPEESTNSGKMKEFNEKMEIETARDSTNATIDIQAEQETSKIKDT